MELRKASKDEAQGDVQSAKECRYRRLVQYVTEHLILGVTEY